MITTAKANGNIRPWHRQADEGRRAYELFLFYRDLDRRCAEAVAEHFGITPGTVSQWITEKKWNQRCMAWDDHLGRVAERAIEKAYAQDAVKYAKRRAAFREQEYTLAEKLMQQAEEMANGPLYLETVEEVHEVKPEDVGKNIATAVTMNPTKWNKRDAGYIGKIASEIMRLSLEMDTSRAVIDIRMPDDVRERLPVARAVLAKLRGDVTSAAENMIAADPALGLEREKLTAELLASYPGWVASNFKLDVRDLTEDEDMVDKIAEQIAVTPVNDHTSLEEVTH